MKILIALLILVHVQAHAQLDKASQEALANTKDLLTDPAQRKEALKGDPKGQEADKKAEALVGSGQNKEELYSIASKVMEKVAAEANGDPQKMQELLMQAQKNPEAFYNKYFTAEEKARTRGLATKIESQKSKGSTPH